MFLFTAYDLARNVQGGFNDNYVHLSFVPAVDNRKWQTTIYRNNPNPFSDEHLSYLCYTKTLVLQVISF
jgi:hypothetical protein